MSSKSETCIAKKRLADEVEYKKAKVIARISKRLLEAVVVLQAR